MLRGATDEQKSNVGPNLDLLGLCNAKNYIFLSHLSELNTSLCSKPPLYLLVVLITAHSPVSIRCGGIYRPVSVAVDYINSVFES